MIIWIREVLVQIRKRREGGAMKGSETGAGVGPIMSQEGEAGASELPRIVLGCKGEGLVSRCLVKETWKVLKTWEEAGSQSQKALEWGAYPIKMEGLERA